MENPRLTKSTYVLGKRCKKALYFDLLRPEMAKDPSKADIKSRWDGIEVGAFARSRYPEGILIEENEGSQALLRTREQIQSGALVLFEAAFQHNGVLIRTDIIRRETVGSPWKLYEVKSSLGKDNLDIYAQDIAIQLWVLKGCGIEVDGAFLMHLNSGCTFRDLDSLFIVRSMVEEIAPLMKTLDEEISQIKQALQQPSPPEVPIGPQCLKPDECPYKAHCWKEVPKPGIFEIPKFRDRWKFYREGKVSAHDLSPKDFKGKEQRRALHCYQSGKPFFDLEKIRKSLRRWKWPLSYFDIEAITYPIPKFANSRAWQSIPFQFSCHIQQEKDSPIGHFEFLHQDEGDPRLSFIKAMEKTIPKEGSIVVYFAPFEIGRLKELAKDFPEYAPLMHSYIDRIVDLMKVVHDHVFHPEFLGSFSIKKVAPALLGKEASYAGLGVKDGMDAMVSYLEMLENPERKAIIRDHLLAYCKQDTFLMVRLHHYLIKITAENSSV